MLHFTSFWLAPGGSGGPLGSPWGRFGRSRGAFWHSRGCFLRSPRRSRRRSGTSLRNETFVGRVLLRFGLRVCCFVLLALSVAGAVILPCSCVAFSLCFLLSFVVVCCARKRRARRIYCKSSKNFMICQCWSRRPRFETRTEHEPTTSSNATFPGDQTCSIFFIFLIPRGLANGMVEEVSSEAPFRLKSAPQS